MNEGWLMPEENEQHLRTWISFGASARIWGRDLVERVREDLANIAQTIARYEPVMICVREKELELAKEYFNDLTNIDWFVCALDDIWIRDYGAVYVTNGKGKRGAVDFNFNGWGDKQTHRRDTKVAKLMAEASEVELIETELCLEGGGIEIDGQGTAIITESCVLIDNRNPGWSKEKCEAELLRVLGIEKVIWLPGVRGADITDGHTDFYARFTSPGNVVAHIDHDETSPEHELTRTHQEILENATDAKGNSLNVVLIDAPSTVREEYDGEDFCAGYINFYVCNDAVIAMQFGDETSDEAAREKLTELYPDREIHMLDIDGIAAGGGGIHCVTQQEIAE